MYNWERIIKDKVPCYFYNTKSNKTTWDISRLSAVCEKYGDFNQKGGEFKSMDGNYYLYCEPIRTEDQIEYKLKEKETNKGWRPCKNWEEFKPFWGKNAKNKEENRNIYMVINYVDFDDDLTGDNKYLFNNYELLEPVNGSTIIGVCEEVEE